MQRFIYIAQRGSQHAGEAWQTVNRQPSWVVKAAALAFILVIGLPILFLVLLAMFVAVTLFFALAAVHKLIAGVRGVLPQRDGRKNVRVIQRADEGPWT
jgi:predicted PurR-regulated permease PerM